jgi:nucleoside-diphosphate-sugar epimerase
VKSVLRRNSGDRLHDALGWGPRISLEEGMTRLYNWIEAQVADALEAEVADAVA